MQSRKGVARLGLKRLLILLAALFAATVSTRNDPDIARFIDGTPESMKGYELYSWQTRGDWTFALVVGTNRIKTYDEFSSSEVRIQGLEALKSSLDQLPGGEQVFWSARRVPGTTLPPNEIINEIRAYCRQQGIQLEVEQALD